LYSEQSRIKEAEDYYLRAIKKGNVNALNNLAKLYSEQSKIKEAEDYYLQAIEKGDVDALNNLAIFYSEQSRIKEAEDYYLQAIEKGDVDALNNLAILYQEESRIEEAEKYYLKAIKKNHIDSYCSLSAMYYDQNIKNHKKRSWELMLDYEKEKKDNKVISLKLLLKLWRGDLQAIDKLLEKILPDDFFGEVALTHLLVHHQSTLVNQAFTTHEKAEENRQRFLPVYYALLDLEDKEETNKQRLKIPPEIVETKDEIVEHIKERRAFYYPKK